MARNTPKLKELIYDTLIGDAPLVALLGDVSKIKHGSPLQLAEYPCVVYNIITESDNPYDNDRSAGIARTRLAIQVFSSSDSSLEADEIEDQIYTLLNGSTLSNSDILMYSIYRVSRSPIFEPDHNVWRIESRYDLTNVGL